MTPKGFVTQKIVSVHPPGVSFGFQSLSGRETYANNLGLDMEYK